MTGVIYARYSAGPKQTEQSIEGQVAECRAYAAREGVDVVGVYADRHVSGKSTDGRYEFQRLLLDAEAHRFDAVIVWKVDRFGRNRTDIALAKLKLKRAGVRLMYAAESVPDGPEGIILESVLEGVAEYYSAELSQKVRRGAIETMKKGLYVGGPLPVGYKTIDRRVVPDPVTAPIARTVFERYAAGASVGSLVAFLKEKGIRGARGSEASSALVYRMLRNRRYLGEFDQYGVELRVEPIVSPELFAQVAERLPSARTTRKGSDAYLLSCRCHCGYCGALLVGSSGTARDGSVRYYYDCGARRRGSDCSFSPVKAEDLEGAVLRATSEEMLTDETIEALVTEALRIQDLDEDPAAPMRAELADVERRLSNLARVFETGNEDAIDLIAGRASELRKRQRELEGAIARAELSHPKLSREVLLAWLNGFKEGDLTDPVFCRRLLDTFVARIEVRDGEAVVFYNMTDKKSAPSEPSAVRTRRLWWSKWCDGRTAPRLSFIDGFAVLRVPLPKPRRE